jgi:hypothetical protein
MVWFAGPHILTDGPFRFQVPGDRPQRPAPIGDPDISENEYEGIVCPACTRLHFIDRKTGKLLGEAKK